MLPCKYYNYLLFSLEQYNAFRTQQLINRILEQARVTQFLGIYVDENLNWVSHIELVGKVSTGIYMWKQPSLCVDRNFLLKACFAFIFAHLCHGTLLWWAAALKCNIQPFRLLKAAVRIIAIIMLDESCSDAFKSIGPLTLPGILVLECILCVIQGKTSLNLSSDSHHNYTITKSDVHPMHNVVYRGAFPELNPSIYGYHILL